MIYTLWVGANVVTTIGDCCGSVALAVCMNAASGSQLLVTADPLIHCFGSVEALTGTDS